VPRTSSNLTPRKEAAPSARVSEGQGYAGVDEMCQRPQGDREDSDQGIEAARFPLERAPGPATILLVEDDEGIRGLLRAILLDRGYVVLDASQGGEALRIADNYEGPIQLLLTDVMMPVMGGPELAERLAPLRPQMRVLYMSASPESALVCEGAVNTGAGFLQKPFTVDVLEQKLLELLDRVG
jgi:CheY-like chemotaxis protein